MQNQDLRNSLLAEMAQHTLAITRIKTRLNTLVSISTLPPELLVMIFQTIVQSYEDHRVVGTSPYAWISFTHVCTHWREVALSIPALWSDIVLPCRLNWVRELLVRSQSAPLYIHHRISTPPHRRTEDLHALQLALGALQRIRLLKLCLPWETYQKVAPLLHAPAPRLKHLALYTSNILSCIGRAPPVLPLSFDVHPQLETLDLSAYSVSWSDLASCRNLRSFSIDYAPFMRPTLHTVAEVLNTLRGLPLLEVLCLTNVMLAPLPTDTQAGFNQSTVVTLAHLKQLVLCGDAAPCASLLDHLLHPSNTRMEFNYSHIADTEFPLLLPSLRSKLSGESTLGPEPPALFQSLAFGLDFKRSLVIRAWTTTVGMTADGELAELEEAPVAFHLELPRWALEYEQIWDAVPLRGVRALWITSSLSEELTVPALTGVLQRMPDVTAACFANWSGRKLVELLFGLANRLALEEGPNSTRRLTFPAMQELVLRNVVFDPCIGHKGHSGCLRDLQNTLKARSRHCALPVSRVVLQKCVHIIADQVITLKETVDKVVWDGTVRVSDNFETDSDSESGEEAVDD